MSNLLSNFESLIFHSSNSWSLFDSEFHVSRYFSIVISIENWTTAVMTTPEYDEFSGFDIDMIIKDSNSAASKFEVFQYSWFHLKKYLKYKNLAHCYSQSHYREVLRWGVSNGARHNWKRFLAYKKKLKWVFFKFHIFLIHQNVPQIILFHLRIHDGFIGQKILKLWRQQDRRTSL